MKTPKQVKDVAAFIGMMLRSTGKVKRGLGTIRQDVNVSVKGGERAEIKGVQDLKMIDVVVELEATRQLNLLKLREEMISRKVKPSHKDIIDYTAAFKNANIGGFIKKGLDSNLSVFGKVYPNMKGFFGFDVNPNRKIWDKRTRF